MSSQTIDRVHPVLGFAHRLSDRLDDVAAVPVWSLTEEEHREVLRVIARDEAKLAALKLRVLVEADRAGATDAKGDGSAADWLAGRPGRSAARLVRTCGWARGWSSATSCRRPSTLGRSTPHRRA